MTRLNLLLASLVCIGVIGCGEGESQKPSVDEVSSFLAENPEIAEKAAAAAAAEAASRDSPEEIE